jgi:hypothetical protein
MRSTPGWLWVQLVKRKNSKFLTKKFLLGFDQKFGIIFSDTSSHVFIIFFDSIICLKEKEIRKFTSEAWGVNLTQNLMIFLTSINCCWTILVFYEFFFTAIKFKAKKHIAESWNYRIGLHHPIDGITKHEDKLLHFIQLKYFFSKEKKALDFNLDMCCHLALCLWLILFHWNPQGFRKNWH